MAASKKTESEKQEPTAAVEATESDPVEEPAPEPAPDNRALAEKLMAQAAELLEQAKLLAESSPEPSPAPPPPHEDGPGFGRPIDPDDGDPVTDDGYETEADSRNDEIVGMPPEAESEIAKRDPLVPMHMEEELSANRELLKRFGFSMNASSGDGEVWTRRGPQGEAGHRATMMADVHGRLRLEIRPPAAADPRRSSLTEVCPAYPIDVEIALQKL
jgi:hypothetical protein